MPKDTNLHKAAYKGEVNTVEELLDQGDDVNCRGAQQRTPLHRAVGKGHNAVIEVLIKRGADVNLVDGGGLTPMHWAALFGLVSTGEILQKATADLNIQTKSGETALHLCAEKGKIEFVKFLLAAGARTDIRDKGAGGGATAYDSAKKAGQKDIMALLKPEGEKGQGCCLIMWFLFSFYLGFSISTYNINTTSDLYFCFFRLSRALLHFTITT